MTATSDFNDLERDVLRDALEDYAVAQANAGIGEDYTPGDVSERRARRRAIAEDLARRLA